MVPSVKARIIFPGGAIGTAMYNLEVAMHVTGDDAT